MYIFACQKYSSITGQHYYFSRKRVLVLCIYNEIIVAYVFKSFSKAQELYCYYVSLYLNENNFTKLFISETHKKNLFIAFLDGIQSYAKLYDKCTCIFLNFILSLKTTLNASVNWRHDLYFVYIHHIQSLDRIKMIFALLKGLF